MLANVKIEQDKENLMIHRVYLDGKEIKRITAVEFSLSSEFLPEVNITVCGGCDFEGMADIHFDYSPYNVREACKILLEELLKHGELYDGFKASIVSAINDAPNYTPTEEISERILKRIIGEE